MKSVFSLSFLWAMSIGILIIPSLVPFPAYINLVALLFVLLLHITFNNSFRAKRNFIVPVVAYVLLSSVLSADQGVVNFSKQLFCLGFMALVFASANEKQHASLLRSYIVFCVIMSVCGGIASILINTQLVSLNEFKVNLTKLTDSRFNWDEDIEYGFNAPYGLGLVLTKGSTLYYFLSVPFFRSSGWSYEPTFASFFIAPSLILLIREKLFRKKTRIVMSVFIIFFMLCCFSLASIAALLSLVIVFKILNPKKKISRKIIWLILIGISSYFVVNIYNSYKSAEPGIDLIESKLSDDNLSGINIFKYSRSPSELFQVMIIILYVSLILLVSVPAIRSGGLRQTMGLILLYLILHSVKGSWYHTITLNFSFVFFLYLANRKEVQTKALLPET